jgi:hypothetical protein
MLSLQEKAEIFEKVFAVAKRYNLVLDGVDFCDNRLDVNVVSRYVDIQEVYTGRIAPPDEFASELKGIADLYVAKLNSRRGYRLDKHGEEPNKHAS